MLSLPGSSCVTEVVVSVRVLRKGQLSQNDTFCSPHFTDIIRDLHDIEYLTKCMMGNFTKSADSSEILI